MYPKNAASPPRIAIGAVLAIADGAIQSSGVSIVVRAEGGSETAGGGTVTYGASSNIVYYAPTQAETNYSAFVVTAYKALCIPISQTIITTASAVAGETVVTGLIPANLDATVSSRSTLSGTVAANMIEINGNATAAQNLEESAKAIITGAAEAGTLSNTGCTTSLVGFIDDDLINRAIIFNGGAANGCGALITGYNATNGEILFTAGIATTVVAGDTFVVV